MDKLTKEDLAEIQILLENTLKPDTQMVNQSEQALGLLRSTQPDKLVLSFLCILVNSLNNYKSSAVHLRQMFNSIKNTEKFVWTRLGSETKTLVKYNLAQAVAAIRQSPDVRRHVCLVCSELPGTLADSDETWPELFSAMEVLLDRRADESMKLCGLKLLRHSFPYFTSSYTQNLRGLRDEFEFMLTNDSFPVKAGCLKAIMTIISLVEEEQREMFESLVPLVTESILSGWQDEKTLKSIIVKLISLAKSNPRFLKQGFSKLFQVAAALVKTTLQSPELPNLAIEFLITAIERAPSLLLEDKMVPETGVYFSELFDAILYFMQKDVQEFPNDWTNPASPLDLPFDYNIVLGQGNIDRVLACTRRDFGLSLLDPQILKLFSGDWRCKYVALIAGARIGPFARSAEELSVLIPSCDRALKSPDPRIRLSAVRALKHLAEESDEVFHSYYHKEVIEGLLRMLEDDVGKLRLEGCIALKSFVGKLKRQELDCYIEPLMRTLTKLIDSDLAPIDEMALTTIGVAVEVTPGTFSRHYYSRVTPILISYLNSVEMKYRKLREPLVEVLTIIAKAAGKERFRFYFPQLAKVMTEMQRAQLDSMVEERMGLLASWQRLCKLYGADLAPFIDEIVPLMVELAKPPAESYVGNRNYHDEECSEKEQGLILLAIFVECLGSGLEKYAPLIEELLVSILRSMNNETLKTLAIKSLKNLLTVAKGKYNIERSVKNSLAALICALKNDKTLSNTAPVIIAMREILLLLEAACFTEAEVAEMLEELMNFALDSNVLFTFIKEQLNETKHSEANILSLLAQTIAALIRTHPNEFTDVFQLVYRSTLKDCLLVPPSSSRVIFALSILAAALRFLTYARIPGVYEESVELVMRFVMHGDPQVRSVALEGLTAAVLGAGEHSATVAEQCFEFIEKALTASMPEQVNRKDWQIAKEKAVICLSHIILSQTSANASKAIEMIGVWLHNLPLKHSQERGKEQIDLLAGMLSSNFVQVVGSNGENLREVLRVVAEVLDTAHVDKFSSQRLLEHLRTVAGMKKWQREIEEAFNALSKSVRDKLNVYANRLMQDN